MALTLNLEESSAPLRDAASVVLLRDAAQGMEVFLMQRHGQSDVLGGAYVFPGGKVDREDAEIDAHQHLDQPADRLHRHLGEPDLGVEQAVALYVAALREAFEECGVLLAAPEGSSRSVDAAQAMALLREGHALDEVLGLMGLRLQTRDVHPWSRWITPKRPSLMQKRFDTRFFVAVVPPGQTALHDGREATDSLWITPRAALERYWRDELPLAPPQIMSIAHLAHHGSVDSVLAEARTRQPPVIQPEALDLDGTRHVCYPGDPAHPLRDRALPGPTRLRYVNGRFEPLDGFEAFFA